MQRHEHLEHAGRSKLDECWDNEGGVLLEKSKEQGKTQGCDRALLAHTAKDTAFIPPWVKETDYTDTNLAFMRT